jgi:hypothetical protein
MAKENQRYEQEFIASAREKTGRDVPAWMPVIQVTGMDKPNAILNWLKQEHKLNHAQAAFLAGIYLNNGKPVYDFEVLFNNLFQDKQDLLPTYRALEKQVRARLPEAEFAPTKTYISIEGKKCFACATLTKKNIRVGLDLGDMPFGDYVQKAKSLGAMPNITHMVEIVTPADVSDELVGYVEQAYHRAHKK